MVHLLLLLAINLLSNIINAGDAVCELASNTTNCKCADGDNGCSFPNCVDQCLCVGGGCTMKFCLEKCKCPEGGCDIVNEQVSYMIEGIEEYINVSGVVLVLVSKIGRGMNI